MEHFSYDCCKILNKVQGIKYLFDILPCGDGLLGLGV
jgi:hypothetical protein